MTVRQVRIGGGRDASDGGRLTTSGAPVLQSAVVHAEEVP